MFRNRLPLVRVAGRSVAAGLLLAIALPAAAQDARLQRRERAERATQRLVALASDALAAPGQAHPEELHAVAEDRARLVIALMRDDPAALFRVNLPPGLRESLPESVRALVEQPVALEGEMEILVEDYEKTARTRRYLHAGGRRFELHVAGVAADLQTGDVVGVSGTALGDDLAVAAADSTDGASIVPVATSLPYTFGEQKVLMILVNFQDKQAEPYTAAAAHSLLLGAVSDFNRENSQGQTWLAGDVVGWFTIPVSSTTCDTNGIRTYAQQAAQAAGVSLAGYRRLVYAFPQNACSWWGSAQIGGLLTHAWINGSLATRVLAHELGHNLGVYHSRALDCGSDVLGANCTTIEYGDPADVMGASGVVAHFNAYHKERLGWLNYGSSVPALTVTGSGTFLVDPYTSPAFAPKALKILKETNPTTGRRTWYYVEHRRGQGFDSGLSKNANMLNGVIVHTGSEQYGSSIYVLDMTPETSSWTDPALTVGRTYSDPAAGVSITTVSTGVEGATVRVDFGPSTCVSAAPSVSVAPTATQWAAPGATASWTMSVKSNDSSGCAGASFAVRAVVPSGWSASAANSTLFVAPGQTASTTLQVTSPRSAPDGFYDVRAMADAGSGAGAATGTYAVLSALSVGVATDAAMYSSGQAVTARATVTTPSGPAAGLSVSFTVVKPDRKKVTGTAVTDASGVATWKLSLKGKVPAGVWTVTADTALGGVAGSGSTTFQVR